MSGRTSTRINQLKVCFTGLSFWNICYPSCIITLMCLCRCVALFPHVIYGMMCDTNILLQRCYRNQACYHNWNGLYWIALAGPTVFEGKPVQTGAMDPKRLVSLFFTDLASSVPNWPTLYNATKGPLNTIKKKNNNLFLILYLSFSSFT